MRSGRASVRSFLYDVIHVTQERSRPVLTLALVEKDSKTVFTWRLDLDQAVDVWEESGRIVIEPVQRYEYNLRAIIG